MPMKKKINGTVHEVPTPEELARGWHSTGPQMVVTAYGPGGSAYSFDEEEAEISASITGASVCSDPRRTYVPKGRQKDAFKKAKASSGTGATEPESNARYITSGRPASLDVAVEVGVASTYNGPIRLAD